MSSSTENQAAASANQLKISFEFFPPAGPKTERMMWRSMGQFM